MEKKKEDKTRATRRVSSEEINKKISKRKKSKGKVSSETQVVGKVNSAKTTKKNSKINNGRKENSDRSPEPGNKRIDKNLGQN